MAFDLRYFLFACAEGSPGVSNEIQLFSTVRDRGAIEIWLPALPGRTRPRTTDCPVQGSLSNSGEMSAVMACSMRRLIASACLSRQPAYRRSKTSIVARADHVHIAVPGRRVRRRTQRLAIRGLR